MKSDSPEIHLIASLGALPSKENELRDVLRDFLGPTRNEPGCRRYDMYASDEQGSYREGRLAPTDIDAAAFSKLIGPTPRRYEDFVRETVPDWSE